jgi:hypothetical protein
MVATSNVMVFFKKNLVTSQLKRSFVMTRKCIIVAVALFCLVGFNVNQVAADFLNGVTATAVSNSPGGRNVENTVNGSGFNAATATVTSTNATTMWMSAITTQSEVWVQFDLAQSNYIGQMWVYNYNENWSGALNYRFVTGDIWVANNAVTTTNPTDATPGGWTKIYNNYEFSEAPYSTSYNTPSKITLNTNARYVVINDVVNGGYDPNTTNRYYGLSEVAFTIPEPGSAVLGAVGGLVALLAYAWRRRK